MIANAIIKRAVRTPYYKGHIYHADGSLYMGRYSLFETEYLSARVHHIATADRDYALHDHPWPFISYVLRGGYIECLPVSIEPEWYAEMEGIRLVKRMSGSISYRNAACRHRIAKIEPGTWTLFIYGKVVNPWGFYTPQGKILWRDFLPAPNMTRAQDKVEGVMPDMFQHHSTPYVTVDGIKEGGVQYTCRVCRTHFTVNVTDKAVSKHCA